MANGDYFTMFLNALQGLSEKKKRSLGKLGLVLF
jgi:hypothetical protein